jgi:hypothetical protein
MHALSSLRSTALLWCSLSWRAGVLGNPILRALSVLPGYPLGIIRLLFVIELLTLSITKITIGITPENTATC